jgi:hypothetical protein
MEMFLFYVESKKFDEFPSSTFLEKEEKNSNSNKKTFFGFKNVISHYQIRLRRTKLIKNECIHDS